MPTLANAVAHNLPILRKKLGLTQSALAKKIKSSQKTIAMYEAGKGGLGIRLISKLAVALNVEETDLVRSPSLGIESDVQTRKEFLAVMRSLLALGETNVSDAEVIDVGVTLLSRFLKKS